MRTETHYDTKDDCRLYSGRSDGAPLLLIVWKDTYTPQNRVYDGNPCERKNKPTVHVQMPAIPVIPVGNDIPGIPTVLLLLRVLKDTYIPQNGVRKRNPCERKHYPSTHEHVLRALKSKTTCVVSERIPGNRTCKTLGLCQSVPPRTLARICHTVYRQKTFR